MSMRTNIMGNAITHSSPGQEMKHPMEDILSARPNPQSETVAKASYGKSHDSDMLLVRN